MKPRLLVTGGTGFLGKWVVPLLQEKFEVDLLSRTAPGALRGDLTRWDAGLEETESLKGRYQGMVHLAGLYRLEASNTDCFIQNVSGTSQALRLCRLLEIPVFLNTSSVAAAINSKIPVVKPYDLNFSTPFPDAYSESKAQAEQVIQNWEGAPFLRVNLRPGVLVGDTVNGRIERIDGPYQAPIAMDRLRSLIENFPLPLPLPGDERRRLPLVPVDACARAIARMTEWALENSETGYKSYHLVPQEGLPIRELYKSTLKQLFIRHRGILLVHRMPESFLKMAAKWLIRFPEEELNYLLKFPKYDTSGLDTILGTNWCPEFRDYEKKFWSGYETFVSNR